MTFGELYVEIGDQSVDVVVSLDLQTERWGKCQVFSLHCVDVHLLSEGAEFKLYFWTDKSLNLQYLYI